MNHDIAFLHTARVHIKTFSKLMAELAPQLTVRHDVNEDLLEDARKHGITSELKERICKAMQHAASTNAKVVVCTCSTIGGIAETSGQGFIAMRIDRAMADEAVKIGKRVLVVAALESTLLSTKALIEDSARKLGKTPVIEVLHIKDAWTYFEAGENEMYLQTIAGSLNEHWKTYDVMVLAQASMVKAVAFCEDVKIPILSSPKMGVSASINVLQK